jgi:FkbM family methyltransferase
MYLEKFLVPFYHTILRLSSGRGEHMLAKLDAFLFRANRHVTISDDDKISIIVPPDPHFFRYLLKSHERHISNVIGKLVKPGDVVIDVGANIGYFSAYAAVAVGKCGKVLCFEPEASNFEYLRANCDLWQKNGFKCSAINLAASATTGQATLNIHRFSTYHAIEDEHHRLDKIEGKQVINTITLDEWVSCCKLNSISLLKIDTEGHEAQVLEGAKTLFKAKVITNTILECRSDYLARLIDDFCQEYGLHQLVWDGHFWLKATLQSLSYRTECLLSTEPILPGSLC